MFPHKQQELVENLQNLGERATPTPPSPDDIFSLDIFEDTSVAITSHDVIATPIGPIPKEKASGEIIQILIRNII